MRPSIWMLAVFILVALGIYGGGHYYVFARLVRKTLVPGPLRILIASGFVLLALSFPLLHFFLRKHQIATVFWLNCVSSFWVGLVLYLFLLTAGVDLLRILHWLVSPYLRIDVPWTATAMGLGVLSAALLISLYGLVDASRIRVREIEIPIAQLPSALAGFRIVQISDVHLGSIVRAKELRRIAEKSNALQPDLVVITGDLLDEQAFQFDGITNVLRTIRAAQGVYAVTGNHEFFAGVDRSVAMMKSAGITVLRNRWVGLANGLQIVGRDDPVAARMGAARTPSPDDILQGIDREKPILYLYHTPEMELPELEMRGIDLQLSGHTHAGQVWPGNWITRWIYGTWYGLYRSKSAAIYVSSGAGTWGPPIRVAAPPEIVFFRLAQAAK